MNNQLLSTRNKPVSADLYRGLGCVRQLLSRLWAGQAQEHSLTCCLSPAISQPSHVIENRAAALATTRHALKTRTF